LCKPHRAHPCIKNCESTFCGLTALECTMQISSDTKTQVRHNVSQHTFSEISYGPTRASNIVRQHFTPWMHQNALPNRQIAPSGKMEVQHNVSHRSIYGIRTGPTLNEKYCIDILMAWSHQKALCDLHFTLDVKTLVRRNVSGCAFCGNRTWLTRA
jgi:hypothetical protein